MSDSMIERVARGVAAWDRGPNAFDNAFQPNSQTDTWFAWYPVRTGALGIGPRVWLRRVWRNRSLWRGGLTTIYQPLQDL